LWSLPYRHRLISSSQSIAVAIVQNPDLELSKNLDFRILKLEIMPNGIVSIG